MLEAVKAPLERVDQLAERASALAIGPGLGRGDDERALVRRLLAELALPAVVDADALYQLEPGNWPAPRVLAPHAGGLGRLLGEDSKWVDAHRLEALRRAVERYRCVVLLKGPDTLVGAPGEGVLVCQAGTAALATAGTGGCTRARSPARAAPDGARGLGCDPGTSQRARGGKVSPIGSIDRFRRTRGQSPHVPS